MLWSLGARYKGTSQFVAQIHSYLLVEGYALERSVTFTDQTVSDFLKLTGDTNPIHAEQSQAASAGFSEPVVPGILLASLFPALIGSHFPGAVYASQTLSFRRPAVVGEEVTARVAVKSKRGGKVVFTTECISTGGQVLVDGTALAIIRDRQPGGSRVGGRGGALTPPPASQSFVPVAEGEAAGRG